MESVADTAADAFKVALEAGDIVLEFGHRDDMAMRLAMSNTAESLMSTIGPLAGACAATTPAATSKVPSQIAALFKEPFIDPSLPQP